MMIRSVLVVSDDPAQREAIRSGANRYSDTFAVVAAGDSLEASDALGRGLVCVVILDIASRSFDAVRFLSQTQRDYPDLPIVLLGGDDALHQGNGVLARLGKPFRPGELNRIILQTLKQQADGGIMPGISPAVFVQLVEIERWTCTMRMLRRDTGQGGLLFFRQGQLFDARVGPFRGVEAAQHLFTWEGVTLFIENDCGLTKNRINSEIQPILMQAVVLKDDPGPARPEPPPPPSAREPSASIPAEHVEEEEVDAISDEDLELISAGEDIIERVDNLLRSDLGEKTGVEDRYFDEGQTDAVNALDDLGAGFGLGAFKVGYFQRSGRPDRILLSNHPPVVFDLASRSRQERILDILCRAV